MVIGLASFSSSDPRRFDDELIILSGHRWIQYYGLQDYRRVTQKIEKDHIQNRHYLQRSQHHFSWRFILDCFSSWALHWRQFKVSTRSWPLALTEHQNRRASAPSIHTHRREISFDTICHQSSQVIVGLRIIRYLVLHDWYIRIYRHEIAWHLFH